MPDWVYKRVFLYFLEYGCDEDSVEIKGKRSTEWSEYYIKIEGS